jgi:cytoskeletal protein CcmA (bactofilin family)
MWNRESPAKGEEGRESTMGQPPVSTALPADERRAVAWVGKSVIFIGSLISSEDMTIDGHVEGSIEVLDQALTIGPDADIRADIMARVVTIHGTVTGSIRAGAKVDVCATACINGDLVAPSIVIADGAIVCGRLDTVSGQSEVAKPKGKLAIA